MCYPVFSSKSYYFHYNQLNRLTVRLLSSITEALALVQLGPITKWEASQGWQVQFQCFLKTFIWYITLLSSLTSLVLFFYFCHENTQILNFWLRRNSLLRLLPSLILNLISSLRWMPSHTGIYTVISSFSSKIYALRKTVDQFRPLNASSKCCLFSFGRYVTT